MLLAGKEHYFIDRFGYACSEAHDYPKTDYFRHLGTADPTELIARATTIPESLWETENEAKPNKIAQLNETRHVMFRFITDTSNVFDYSDHPVLWNQWKDALLPVMNQAARALGYRDYRFPRAMLARVPARRRHFRSSRRRSQPLHSQDSRAPDHQRPDRLSRRHEGNAHPGGGDFRGEQQARPRR